MAFNLNNFIREKVEEIKKRVNKERAICATSGGVDSVVCAVLGHLALKDRLIAIFINTGLMRQDEPKQVRAILKKMKIKTKIIQASKVFFKALKGKNDPEQKRKAFRETFYKVLGRTLKKFKANYLIQGTIALDIKETKDKIKSQHNVLSQIGINPKKFGLKIIEPLATLYKSEVRKLAKALGLPKNIYERMPFPGPGLAVRIIGEVTPEKIRIVRKATAIIENELSKFKPFQAFAVLLNDRATGVIKNKRKFGNIIVIRSVESENAVVAKPSKIPYKILEKIEKRIIKEIPKITKVLYDITPKPPSTIEYV